MAGKEIMIKACHGDENVMSLMVDHNAVICPVCISLHKESSKLSSKLNSLGSAFRAKLSFKKKV